MHPLEIKRSLETIRCICDTREQDTERSRERLKRIGFPIVRKPLKFGDYSAECELPDGSVFSLADKVCIERKMNAEELSGCFCQDRERFKREFERADRAGAKIYLLVENTDINKIRSHKYRTSFSPQSYLASLFAWLARYRCQIIFVDEIFSGQTIHDILYREMKEWLENGSFESER